MTKVKEGCSYYIYPFDPGYGEIEVSEVFVVDIRDNGAHALVAERFWNTDNSENIEKRWVRVTDYVWDILDTSPAEDAVVEEVVSKYRQRSKAGKQKYGTTLSENQADLKEWLNHLQEELMDAVLYIERAKEEIK